MQRAGDFHFQAVPPHLGRLLSGRPCLMDVTTLLIIVLVVLLLGGGGFYYGRGRRR